MILYTLTNSSLSLDVYEDKIVMTPKAWKSIVSSKWSSSKVIMYKDLDQVKIEKRYWPMRHRLHFATGSENMVFEYRHLESFFDQLKIFLERQILRQHQSLKPTHEKIRSVTEIINERKNKKIQSNSISA